MTKIEADDLRKVDAAWLRSQGYFKPETIRSGTITWTSGPSYSETKNSISILISTFANSMYAKLNYSRIYDNDEKKEFDYKIPLTTTNCRYGGKRYWFICSLSVNGQYCERRVRTLYQGGDYFGCRHCYNLTYHSRNENSTYRTNPLFRAISLMGKSDDIRETIKVPYYRGKPTRKQRRLERIRREIVINSISPYEAESAMFRSLTRPNK